MTYRDNWWTADDILKARIIKACILLIKSKTACFPVWLRCKQSILYNKVGCHIIYHVYTLTQMPSPGKTCHYYSRPAWICSFVHIICNLQTGTPPPTKEKYLSVDMFKTILIKLSDRFSVETMPYITILLSSLR